MAHRVVPLQETIRQAFLSSFYRFRQKQQQKS